METKEFKEIFSQNLQYYLSKNKKTQTDLTTDLCLTKSVVSSWCTGKRMPRMNNVQMLADYFNIGKSDLIDKRYNNEEVELTILLDGMVNKLSNQTGLMFDGKPASKDSVEAIISAMEVGINIARKKNNEKK